MRYLLALLILLIPISVFSIDSIDSTRYLYAKKAPKTLDVDQLVNYLKKGAKEDKKVVETFFYWISLNIKYSQKLKNKIHISDYDVSVESTLKNKETICEGYAKLLNEMCYTADIECEIINGIAQNYLNKQVDSTNHAWNAVKINNKWLLIDATWGSGSFNIGSNDYNEELDIRYLFAEPNFLIIDHFPEEKKWQLLNPPITLKQFQSEIWKEKRFRKFNDLLDDEEYKNYKEMLKNNGLEK